MGRILKKKQRESNAAGAEGRETLKGRSVSSCGCSRGRPKEGQKTPIGFGKVEVTGILGQFQWNGRAGKSIYRILTISGKQEGKSNIGL